MKAKRLWIILASAAVAIAAVCCIALRKGPPTSEDLEREFRQMEPSEDELGDFADMDKPLVVSSGTGTGKPHVRKGKGEKPAESDPVADQEQADEKQVSAFDDLTDKWRDEASDRTPTMKDIETFAEQFRKLPADRKDECIHRALNLLPDGNVMLLVGILMDKSQGEEILDTIFSDILNRDESVKLPIMKEVIKDPKHPCWKDAAWILDVTKTGGADDDKQDE